MKKAPEPMRLRGFDLSCEPFSVTLVSAEAVPAIDRPALGGLEGHGGLRAALGADGFEHLLGSAHAAATPATAIAAAASASAAASVTAAAAAASATIAAAAATAGARERATAASAATAGAASTTAPALRLSRQSRQRFGSLVKPRSA